MVHKSIKSLARRARRGAKRLFRIRKGAFTGRPKFSAKEKALFKRAGKTVRKISPPVGGLAKFARGTAGKLFGRAIAKTIARTKLMQRLKGQRPEVVGPAIRRILKREFRKFRIGRR